MRTVQTGPVIGLIGQLAVLSVLAGTVGLGATGWLAGTACGLVTAAALVARPHPLRQRSARRGQPGDAHPSHARRWGDRPGGRRARRAGARRRDGRARRRRPRPRRGGRLGRAAYRNGVSAGRALRHGGRRVPDPGPECVRRWIGRPVGARHRRGAVRRLGGRPDGAVAAHAGAPALLAQARGGDPRHRAHGRRGRPAARASRINVAIAVAMVLLAESFGRDVVWQWRQHRVPRDPSCERRVSRAAASPSAV